MYSVKLRRIVHCEHTVALTIETTCWGVSGAVLKKNKLHDQFHAHNIKQTNKKFAKMSVIHSQFIASSIFAV